MLEVEIGPTSNVQLVLWVSPFPGPVELLFDTGFGDYCS